MSSLTARVEAAWLTVSEHVDVGCVAVVIAGKVVRAAKVPGLDELTRLSHAKFVDCFRWPRAVNVPATLRRVSTYARMSLAPRPPGSPVTLAADEAARFISGVAQQVGCQPAVIESFVSYASATEAAPWWADLREDLRQQVATSCVKP